MNRTFFFILKVAAGVILAEIILSLFKFDLWKEYVSFYNLGVFIFYIGGSLLFVLIPIGLICRFIHLYNFYLNDSEKTFLEYHRDNKNKIYICFAISWILFQVFRFWNELGFFFNNIF